MTPKPIFHTIPTPTVTKEVLIPAWVRRDSRFWRFLPYRRGWLKLVPVAKGEGK